MSDIERDADEIEELVQYGASYSDIIEWLEKRDARQAPASGEPVVWNDPAVDPIVSKLYRKFKEWSERGFTADDVTWCEVRGYVAELMSAHPPAKIAEEAKELLLMFRSRLGGAYWSLDGEEKEIADRIEKAINQTQEHK